MIREIILVVLCILLSAISTFPLTVTWDKDYYTYVRVIGGIMWVSFIGVSFFIMINLVLENQKPTINTVEPQVVIEQIAFEDSVKLYINQLNIAHPDIVFKQARIESGNFTSNVFKENNNMFGMRVPRQRPNLSIGENYGYAVYKNWQHSVIDYAILQSWSYRELDKEQYLQQLSHSYAEDTLYIQKIK